MGSLLETSPIPSVKFAVRLSTALACFVPSVSKSASVKVETITKAIITPITNEAIPNTIPVISPPVCPFLFSLFNFTIYYC